MCRGRRARILLHLHIQLEGQSCEGAELVGVLVAETIHPACMGEGGGRGGGERRARILLHLHIQLEGTVLRAVASVAFPPCPTHFLIAHKTAALSHSKASTTPPNSGIFELMPSSSLPTRAHLSASFPELF